ncbi:AraC family transcriptional regulator [Halosquirtibacter xylanolyticus]|uniref:helix-turn-helix transcriptional regulator n=1 Tax=Halosquirtibacter xylanolyticus TaxID=3374599 RepID=UPI00374923CC|nr:AraC family transcriptional regulator [Prolixibacteraceae bacterium]
MMNFAINITSFQEHKDKICEIFDGDWITPNFLQVDTNSASGIIYFHEIHQTYFILFYLTFHEDIHFNITYQRNDHFTHVSSFFNNSLQVQNLNNDNLYKFRHQGFYTSTTNINIKGDYKKGDRFHTIKAFFSHNSFNLLTNPKAKEYFEKKESFFYYFDAKVDLIHLLSSLGHVFLYDKEIQTKLFRLKLEELFLVSMTYLNEVETEPIPIDNKVSDYQQKKVTDIRDRIISDLSHRPNVTELSKEVGIHKNQLQALFQQYYGKTIYNYYTTIRMQKVREMLLAQEMTISEVAYHFGFSSIQHLSSSFTNFFGMSPKSYLDIMK